MIAVGGDTVRTLELFQTQGAFVFHCLMEFCWGHRHDLTFEWCNAASLLLIFIVTVILVFIFVPQSVILVFILLLLFLVYLSGLSWLYAGVSHASSDLQVKETQGFREFFGGLGALLRTEERCVERSGTHVGMVVDVVVISECVVKKSVSIF
jgi:hypothetical protein